MFSPLRYPGGKWHARKMITAQIPAHTAYVEPFCGGSTVFFAKRKASGSNVLNDTDQELTNCLTQVRDAPDALADLVEQWPISKEQHATVMSMKPKKRECLLRAARYFYLNRTSYSGIMCAHNCHYAYDEKRNLRQSRWRDRLLAASRHLSGVAIESRDFEQIIDAAPDGAFLFVDPPYYARLQAKLYNHVLDEFGHRRLMECLRRNSDRLNFLLTYDDHADIRALYSWCRRVEPARWQYSIHRTDRTPLSDAPGAKRRNLGHELIISNF